MEKLHHDSIFNDGSYKTLVCPRMSSKSQSSGVERHCSRNAGRNTHGFAIFVPTHFVHLLCTLMAFQATTLKDITSPTPTGTPFYFHKVKKEIGEIMKT
jgi:hypothetical protein